MPHPTAWLGGVGCSALVGVLSRALPERRAVLCAAMRLDPAAQGDQAWPAREAEGRLLELSVGKFVAAVQL